jgi:hypothetical protein
MIFMFQLLPPARFQVSQWMFHPAFQDNEEASQVHMEEYIDASKIYTAPLLQTEQFVPIFSKSESICVERNDTTSTFSCLNDHGAIVSFEELDDDHDGLDVNAVDSAVGMTTRPEFLEPSRALVKHDPCHKKSVSLRPTLYPFIPTDLFELRLGSDGDVDDNMSAVSLYSTKDVARETWAT